MLSNYRVRAYINEGGEICCASAEHWSDARRMVCKLERDYALRGLVTIIEKRVPQVGNRVDYSRKMHVVSPL